MSLRQAIFEYLEKHPLADNMELYEAFQNKSRSSIRNYKQQHIKNKTSSAMSPRGVGILPVQVGSDVIIKQAPPIPPKDYGLVRGDTPNHNGGALPIDEFRKKSVKARLSLVGDKILEDYYFKAQDKNLSKGIDLLKDKEFIEKGEVHYGIYWTSDTPQYSRPKWLYPWQPKAIDLMTDHDIRGVMYLGSRQKVGKSLSAAFADFELMLYNPGYRITLVAPTRPLAERLLEQMFHEYIQVKEWKYVEEKGFYDFVPTGQTVDIWEEIFRPYFLDGPGGDNATKKVMKNGSRIQIHTLDPKSTQGPSADLIHIEEFDKLTEITQAGEIMAKLKALAGVLGQIRARPNARILITCNRGTGLFRFMRDELYPYGRYFPIYTEKEHAIGTPYNGEHEIYNEDAIVDFVPDNDMLLSTFLDVLVGKHYTASQLYNIDDYTGEIWNPRLVAKAYERGKHYEIPLYMDRTTCGIDPGAGHAFAVSIWGRVGNDVVKRWFQRFFSAKHTKKHVCKTIARKCIEYGVVLIRSESNSGALWDVDMIEHYHEKYKPQYPQSPQIKLTIEMSNFGGVKDFGRPQAKVIPKALFITMMSYLYDAEWLVIPMENDEDRQFKLETSLYNPERAAQGEKFKGDLVECSFHAIWGVVDGYNFVREMATKNKPRKRLNLSI